MSHSLSQKILSYLKESMAPDDTGNIGQFAVTREALSKFFRLGVKSEFWHPCQKEDVKKLYEEGMGETSGYLHADLLDKLSKEASGELVLAKCSGTICKNDMLNKNMKSLGNDAFEIKMGRQPFLDELDGKKARFIFREYCKKEIIAEFNEKFGDMPRLDYAMDEMEFIRNYWENMDFRHFARQRDDGAYRKAALEMGDECILRNASSIRALFVSEPILAKNCEILALYATPNTKRWLDSNLPHFKVTYVNPKQFEMLRLNVPS